MQWPHPTQAARIFFLPQREFRPWEPPHFESLFQISRSFQNVVNAEDTQLRFSSAIMEEAKKIVVSIFDYFWQKYWSQGDQKLHICLH